MVWIRFDNSHFDNLTMDAAVKAGDIRIQEENLISSSLINQGY